MKYKSKLLCIALASVFASPLVFAKDYILQSDDEISFAENTNRGGYLTQSVFKRPMH